MTERENLPSFEETKARRRRTYLGLLGGIVLGVGLGQVVPAVRENIDFLSMVLWSGAIGVMAANLGQFEKAGAILTRSENRVLNYAVGLGVPVLFLLVVYFVKRLFF